MKNSDVFKGLLAATIMDAFDQFDDIPADKKAMLTDTVEKILNDLISREVETSVELMLDAAVALLESGKLDRLDQE